MLIDRHPPEDIFVRVPELADQIDPVLLQLDYLLDDDVLSQQVRADLAHRYRLTPVHGRHSTPVEALLRMLVVQHLYAWSYQETVERVADSLVLRWFTRVYFQRVPDKTTLLRWAQTIQPATLHALIDRSAQLAQQAHVTRARKLRLDSTCAQTTIHHPTDSGLLGDGVRVLTRLIQRAKPLIAEPLAGVRDAFRSRMRSARRVLQQLHRARRRQGEDATETQRDLYARLLQITHASRTSWMCPRRFPHHEIDEIEQIAWSAEHSGSSHSSTASCRWSNRGCGRRKRVCSTGSPWPPPRRS